MKKVLPFLLVTMCIVRIPGPDARLSFQLSVEFGVMIMFAVVLARANMWVGLFYIVVLLSSMSQLPSIMCKISGGPYPINGILANPKFLAREAITVGLMWYYFVATGKTEFIPDCICVVALCNVAMLCLQYFNIDPLWASVDGTKKELVGLMSNPNEVSALLAVCAPFFFRKNRWYGLVLIGIGLVLARSFGGMVSIAAGVSLYMILKGHRVWGAVFPVLGVLAYLLIDVPGIHERTDAWAKAWELYLQKPMGYGLGNWQVTFPKINGGTWETAHNDFIQGVYEMGPLFAVVVCGYLVNTARRVWRLSKQIKINFLYPELVGAVVVCVNASVHFLFHVGTTAILAVTIFACLENKLRKAE